LGIPEIDEYDIEPEPDEVDDDKHCDCSHGCYKCLMTER
jgi:hypothetical protein